MQEKTPLAADRASDLEASGDGNTRLARREIVYRHSLTVRATHWMNALCLALLLMSGLRILAAHPALYWGNYGYYGVPSFISISDTFDDVKARELGVTRIGNYSFDTTGFLGVGYGPDRQPVVRAFPRWVTLGGSLGIARDWHFLLAWAFVINGTVYLLAGFLTGHFRRDLAPSARELGARSILRDIFDHLRLRRARGEAAKRYNVLQKLAYVAIVFVLLPLMVLSGLTMSPAVTAVFPFLFDIFGGRQSARTIHFIAANLLLIFVFIHVLEVLLSGAFNLMRSMITGRYAVSPEGPV
jgi:thiosulfate reductase cytochrome b subunit